MSMRTTHPTPPTAAAFLLAAAAALFGLPFQAAAQAPVWSTELTVGRPGAGDAVGYCQGAANCSAEAGHYGALGEPGFRVGETDHVVTSIRWGVGGEGFIHLTLDRALGEEDLAGLALHLDATSLTLAEARVNAPGEHAFAANYTWDGDEAAPDVGATVQVSLTREPGPDR